MTADVRTAPESEGIKDAVHVAVISQKADRKLKAGERRALGVVDPFGALEVKKGELYWLYLTPGTVANLRHEWDHPDIDEPVPVESVQELKEENERLKREMREAADADYNDYGGCRGC